MAPPPNNPTTAESNPAADAARSPTLQSRTLLSTGIRAALGGIFVNGLLAMAKLVAGLLGNSYALVADAVESMADIAGSTVVWGGLTVASRPPDENHPYGHGRAESLAALAVAFMLLGSAVGIGIQAVREILIPHHAPASFTLPVLLGVVLVKESLHRRVARIGRRLGSTAIETDAWHHRSDALTSLAAAVGITIALIGGEAYASADDWAALAACAVVAANGLRFLRRSVDDLMDVRPDETLLAGVCRAALAVPGALGIEKVFARKMGSRFWVDLHLEVDPGANVKQGHQLAHGVKDAVLAWDCRIADVLVHVEPFTGPLPADSGGQPRPVPLPVERADNRD